MKNLNCTSQVFRGMSESESRSSNDEAEEEYDGSDNSGDESDRIEGGDGMADMMSKILHQQVHGKVPVLAKRKTAIMKELESEYADKDRLKKLKLKRQEQRVKHMVVPDHTTLDYERQLKKIATRGGATIAYVIPSCRNSQLQWWLCLMP
jgi:hypothetical protein